MNSSFTSSTSSSSSLIDSSRHNSTGAAISDSSLQSFHLKHMRRAVDNLHDRAVEICNRSTSTTASSSVVCAGGDSSMSSISSLHHHHRNHRFHDDTDSYVSLLACQARACSTFHFIIVVVVGVRNYGLTINCDIPFVSPPRLFTTTDPLINCNNRQLSRIHQSQICSRIIYRDIPKGMRASQFKE